MVNLFVEVLHVGLFPHHRSGLILAVARTTLIDISKTLQVILDLHLMQTSWMLTDIWAMLLHIKLLLTRMLIVQLLKVLRRRNRRWQPTRSFKVLLLLCLLKLLLFLMLLLDLWIDLMPLVGRGLHILLVKLKAKGILLGNLRFLFLCGRRE